MTANETRQKQSGMYTLLSEGSGSEMGRAETASETVAGEGAREIQVLLGREECFDFGAMMCDILPVQGAYQFV